MITNTYGILNSEKMEQAPFNKDTLSSNKTQVGQYRLHEG